MIPDEAITVLIPTSPITANPSTEIIDETYAQLRKHLPKAEVLLLMDGVHPEEQYLAERYDKFKARIWQKSQEWNNFKAISFEHWEHQSGMLQNILLGYELVKTPLVFWSEHDIPLKDDYVNWQGIVDTLLDGDLGGIRFELTGDPPKKDEIRGKLDTNGISILLSTQYVNWPQVFRLDYLKEFVATFGDSKTYLECSEYDGIVGRLWSKFKYGIYEPDVRHCYHTDGRSRASKGLGKPFVVVNGRQRNWYGQPYKPLEEKV